LTLLDPKGQDRPMCLVSICGKGFNGHVNKNENTDNLGSATVYY